MARTVKDSNLQTRSARERLRIRHEPYWRSLDKGAHLGYRKGRRGGMWIARWRVTIGEPKGTYKKKVLGKSDDKADADGTEILDYSQAQIRARETFVEWADEASGRRSRPYKVSEAVTDYLEDYEARGGKALASLKLSIDAHIVPSLGEINVAELTDKQIRDWHRRLAARPARLRSKRTRQRYRCRPTAPDEVRKRKVTANKILSMLKAALNFAFREGKVGDDKAWRKVRPYQKVDAPRIRYLTEAEAVRLVNACEPEFRALVKAALLTGCRYGELVVARCSDFNSDVGTLHVRPGKSGRARDVTLTDEGQKFFSRVVRGKSGKELMFTRSDGEPWGKSHQKRRLEVACHKAKVEPAISFHILRHCAGSWLAMKGVPMAVIAHHLGHADQRIAERHYAHLAPSYLKETIRNSFPKLGILDDSNIIELENKA